MLLRAGRTILGLKVKTQKLQIFLFYSLERSKLEEVYAGRKTLKDRKQRK